LGLRLKGLKMILTFKKSVYRKKKYSFDRNIKNAFDDPKSLKMVKAYFWQKLENNAFAQKPILI
jgi:hypothetical protein